MAQAGEDPRLAAEALGDALVGDKVAADELEGDGAIEGEVGSAEDDTHAALAEHGVEAVLAIEELSEQGIRTCHGRLTVQGRGYTRRPRFHTTRLGLRPRRSLIPCGASRDDRAG